MAKRKESNIVSRIRYTEYDPNDKQPELAVYALDRNRKALKVANVDRTGEFSLPDDVVNRADSIVIGPKSDDIFTVDRTLLVT